MPKEFTRTGRLFFSHSTSKAGGPGDFSPDNQKGCVMFLTSPQLHSFSPEMVTKNRRMGKRRGAKLGSDLGCMMM